MQRTKSKNMETVSVLNSKEQITQASYDLVKGVFTPDEAAEIIEDLFLKKINFNKQKNFKLFIQSGKESEAIEERIQELKKAYQNAEQQILEAKQAGKSVRLSSIISLQTL